MEKIQQVHGEIPMCKASCQANGNAKSDSIAMNSPARSPENFPHANIRHTKESKQSEVASRHMKTEIPNSLRRVWYEEISQSFQDFQQRYYSELRGLYYIDAIFGYTLTKFELIDLGIARCHPCERKGISKGAKTCCNAPKCPYYQEKLCRECFDCIHPMNDSQLRSHVQILSISTKLIPGVLCLWS